MLWNIFHCSLFPELWYGALLSETVQISEWFHAKYVAKKFSWNNFLVSECIFKLQQIRDIFYGRERNRLKTTVQVTQGVYPHVILFRMHGKGTATEKVLDTVLQMSTS